MGVGQEWGVGGGGVCVWRGGGGGGGGKQKRGPGSLWPRRVVGTFNSLLSGEETRPTNLGN